MLTNCKKTGHYYEMKASDYLKSKNYIILDSNYRCSFGEIDLIALSPDKTIVFIEVKARNSHKYGYASEAITPSKCYKIRKTSYFYIKEKNYDLNRKYRYDVITFQNNKIEHLINAFN